jgi:hypothetical protein
MQEREDIIENTDKEVEETENPIGDERGDGKFHKIRRKNTHLMPKKKKRK